MRRIDKAYMKRVATREYQNNTGDMAEAYIRGMEAAMKRAGLFVVTEKEYFMIQARRINTELRTYDGRLGPKKVTDEG